MTLEVYLESVSAEPLAKLVSSTYTNFARLVGRFRMSLTPGLLHWRVGSQIASLEARPPPTCHRDIQNF